MRSLVELAAEAREADRVAGLCAPQLCTECMRPLPKGGKGRAAKIHQTPECRKAYLHRTRYGWRKPAGHKAYVPTAETPARAEYRAAVAAARRYRRTLKALVARGRGIPDGE